MGAGQRRSRVVESEVLDFTVCSKGLGDSVGWG